MKEPRVGREGATDYDFETAIRSYSVCLALPPAECEKKTQGHSLQPLTNTALKSQQEVRLPGRKFFGIFPSHSATAQK